MSTTNLQELWATKASLSQAEVDELHDMFESIAKALNSVSVQWQVIAGSALGLARHGGLMPHDDDVDIAILTNDAQIANAALRQMAEYETVRADIGFKIGKAGTLKQDVLVDTEHGLSAVGSESPFTSITMDVFFLTDIGHVDGVPCLGYDCKRARQTWPDEVLPASGWSDPKQEVFGNYISVFCLPDQEMDWYLRRSFGSNWRTHDGQGRRLKSFICATHSKLAVSKETPKK